MGVARLVAESASYLVLYKPALTHTVPLREGEEGTLLNWAAHLFPEVAQVRGYKAVEGGIVHRLDYETEGLVLAARTQAAFDALRRQQETGVFIKEYTALVEAQPLPLAGFPPAPCALKAGALISSGFRAFGPGRRAVRPVLSGLCSALGRYETAVYAVEDDERGRRCHVRLARGFRHQARCHLAWLGYPICGDVLYGGTAATGPLALTARALQFQEPVSGEERRYTLESTSID